MHIFYPNKTFSYLVVHSIMNGIEKELCKRNVTRIPPISVHKSPLRAMSIWVPLDLPLFAHTNIILYLWVAKHCEQFACGSKPNKHPVCTSGLWIRTFDPDFTRIGFSVKKQHQLLCWILSTATPVHCKVEKKLTNLSWFAFNPFFPISE